MCTSFPFYLRAWHRRMARPYAHDQAGKGFDWEREESRAGSPLPEGQLVSAFRESLMKAWKHERLQSEPSTFPPNNKQPGVQMSKYKHWMGLRVEGAAPLTMQGHSRAFISVARHKALMRFRPCCWPLTANRAYGRPREERQLKSKMRIMCSCGVRPTTSCVRVARSILQAGCRPFCRIRTQPGSPRTVCRPRASSLKESSGPAVQARRC